jgi:hypothetical protein
VNLQNGVLHIRCPNLIPDKQNFITLPVDRFEIDHEPVEMAIRRLRDVIKVAVSPPKQQSGRGGIGGSLGYNPDDPKISMKMNNVTVGEILDKMALSSAKKIWIVTFSDNSTVTASGFRRTLTLWNNHPIPDEEPPLWDMLYWGDASPTAVLGRE